ncbi:MAG: carbon-nitrogen family hydrolase [Syntrophobacteraceae bacterium]
MKVCSIQMAVIEEDKRAAIDKAVEAVSRCRGADLVILPEIWNIGFLSFDRYIAEAESREGPTLTAMRAAAKDIGVFLCSGSFVERDGGNYYNSSFLIGPNGDILASYRKIHLFGYNSRETEILTPGNRLSVVQTPLGTIGMATCFDLRFPELFRAMVDRGAEVFLICSAWPAPRLEHWILLNRTRALENQCFLISANCAGSNRGVQFAGHSMVVDPWGAIAADGGDVETVVSSEIELAAVHDARRDFPALAGRVGWLNGQRGEP